MCTIVQYRFKMKNKFDIQDDDTKEKGRKIPSYFLLALLGYYIFIGFCTSLIENKLPNPVTVEEAGLTGVSEQRTRTYLEEIVGEGPRVAGTRHHLTKSKDLMKLLEDVTANSKVPVHLEWQYATGDYWLNTARPFVNMYYNLTNIIAVLEGESGFNADGTSNSSILFNCHHDTVPTSPGVGDNAVFCATLVEALNILSKNDVKLKHNIIFLFNGAEETSLQAAHGFLRHPWAKGVTALVNLEGAGTNCKSMLFQVTDARVLSAYSRSVKMPNAQAIGQVIFGSGIVPSDTDFRIFRDFGEMYGIDVAYSQMGHVYHTKHDSLEVLIDGVVQHSGEMILALAKEMGNSDDFHTRQTDASNHMYYDYLNLFMLDYTWTVAHVVDTIMILIAIGSVVYYHSMVGFRFTMTKELLISCLARLLSAAVGIMLMWIVTAIMVATTKQMRYLANDWIIVPIFWFPYLMGAVATSQLFDAWRCQKCGLNRVRRMSQAMASTRFILVLICFILLCIPGTPSLRYVLVMPLFLMSVVAFISVTVIKKFRIRAWQQLLLECVLCLPAQLFMFIVAIKVNTLMLPIMGRSPTLSPDYTVASLNMIAILTSSLPLSGVELLFSRIRIWITFVVTLVICLAVSFAPMHPYTNEGGRPVPQRHSWFHSEIKTFNEAQELVEVRSGIWFAHTEVHTPKSIPDIALENGITLHNIKTNFDSDCLEYTYCNLPMYTPRTTEFTNNSLWVDFSPPTSSNPPADLRLEQKLCLGRICTCDLSFTGPNHMGITIWPKQGVKLQSWSFESNVKETMWQDNRPVYYIFYGRGTFSEEVNRHEFKLVFEIPDNFDGPLMDVSLSGNRISHEEEFTAELKQLIGAMPDYFNIATFLSSRYNYIF